MSHAVVAAINEYCTAGEIAGFGAAASAGATVAAVGAAGACAAAKQLIRCGCRKDAAASAEQELMQQQYDSRSLRSRNYCITAVRIMVLHGGVAVWASDMAEA